MKKNSQMEALHHEVTFRNLDDFKWLSKTLLGIVHSGFTRVDGCVILAERSNLTGNATLKDFPDRTGYECFVNHLHVEDYLAEDASITQPMLLGQGLALTYLLKEELSVFSAGENFRIIVSSDESSCSVRFHQIREGEEWLSRDLNSYTHEAILFLDTSRASARG